MVLKRRCKAGLSIERIKEMNENVQSDPRTVSLQSAVWNSDLTSIALRPDKLRDAYSTFSHLLPEDNDVTALDQERTGTCWIFAGLNVMRHHLIRRHSLPGTFELSQPYVYMCNMMERANLAMEIFLEQLNANTEDEVLSRRIMDDTLNDGGNIAQFINIVEKYGVVPVDAFPKSVQGKNTTNIRELLRLTILPKMVVRRDDLKSMSRKTFERFKDALLCDCHRILTYGLGSMPDEFDWNGKQITPLRFLNEEIKPLVDMSRFVPLINDPRKPYNRVVYTPFGHNVLAFNDVGQEALSNKMTNVFLNVDMETMKIAVFNTVSKYQCPVWFATNYNTFVFKSKSLMSLSVSAFDDIFGVRFVQPKSSMLSANVTQPGHAMIIVGCHEDGPSDGQSNAKEDGDDEETRPTKSFKRWKVENSHGTLGDMKGYLSMSDDYFNEFVLQAFVDPRTLDNDLVKLFIERQDPIRLPYPQAVA